MKTTNLLLTSLALLLCGCGDSGKSHKSDFEGRLKAALSVQEAGQRDEALEIVATDAAAAGNGAVCLAAVKKVASSAQRDLLAVDCAIRLAEAGDSTAASEVANQIGAAGRRSEVNKEIATIR